MFHYDWFFIMKEKMKMFDFNDLEIKVEIGPGT